MNLKTVHRLISLLGLKYYSKLNQAITRKKKITIVSYHSISPISHRYAITPRTFDGQIAFIKQNYKVIKLNQIPEAFGNDEKGVRQLVVTFDDGFSNFFQFAYPILQKHSIPCTMFLPSGLIGQYNVWDSKRDFLPKIEIMNKQELLALKSGGLVDFGSHTIDHVSMRNLSRDEMKRQVVDSKKQLEDLFGFRIYMFAYPYGRLGNVSRLSRKILSESGYEIAVTARWGTLQSHQNILDLKRIFVDEEDDNEDIRAKIEGHYDWFAMKERIGFLFRFREFY